MATVSEIPPEDVFPSEDTPNVDFEIAFTALLATVTLSTSIPTEYPTVIEFFAYSLLLFTLIRRMAVTNSVAENSHILEGTRTLVLAFSYTLIISQLNTIATIIHQALNVATVSMLLVILVLLLFLTWLLIQEIVFGDLSIYLAMISNNAAFRAEDTIFSPLSEYFIDSATRLATLSKAEYPPTPIANLQGDSVQTPRNRIYALGFLVTSIIVFYGTFWLFLSFSSNSLSEASVFLVSALLIQYPVDFLYSRYGAVGFYRGRSGLSMFLPVGLGTLISILFI